MDSRSVITSFFAYWRVQDLEMALQHMHPDVVYEIHNGPDASPLAGVYRGIQEIRELGYTVLSAFDYVRYEPTIASVEDNIVRAHVVFGLRHRQSSYTIEGSQRSIFDVRDGLIARIDLYEDALRVEAFMRMARETTPSDIDADLAALLGKRQKSGAGA